MKKNDKAKQAQKSQGRVPRQPKGATELTDQDLQQVQGGQGVQKNGFRRTSDRMAEAAKTRTAAADKNLLEGRRR